MRLIDADAVPQEFWEYEFDGKWRGCTIKDLLDSQPTIQPEIIRCKDCKYAEYIDDVKTLWCTECGQGRTVAPDDFCSYAERREETTWPMKKQSN